MPDQIVAYDAERRQTGDDLVRAAARLAETDGVAFATPNFVSQYQRGAAAASRRPPRSQWHLPLVGAFAAWRKTRGKPAITIAIVDDGVDLAHPDLRANIRLQAGPARAPRSATGATSSCATPIRVTSIRAPSGSAHRSTA